MDKTTICACFLLIIGTACWVSVYQETLFGNDTLSHVRPKPMAAPAASGVAICYNNYTAATSITPNSSTYYRVNFTLTDADSMADLVAVDVYLFRNSTHYTNYNTTTADGVDLVNMTWTEATDNWTLNQGAMTEWILDNTTSIDPGAASAATIGNFSMRFRPSKVASAAADWIAAIQVRDATITDYANSTAFTMNTFFDLAFNDTTFTWATTLEASSVNNTMTCGVNMTVYANAAWVIQLSASDFSSAGYTAIDTEGNNTLCWDEDNVDGGTSLYVHNTAANATSTWHNQAAMTTESGVFRGVFFFFSPETWFTGGIAWAVTITINIYLHV